MMQGIRSALASSLLVWEVAVLSFHPSMRQFVFGMLWAVAVIAFIAGIWAMIEFRMYADPGVLFVGTLIATLGFVALAYECHKCHLLGVCR